MNPVQRAPGGAETLAARGELTAEVSADPSARLRSIEEGTAQSNGLEDGEYESSATIAALREVVVLRRTCSTSLNASRWQ